VVLFSLAVPALGAAQSAVAADFSVCGTAVKANLDEGSTPKEYQGYLGLWSGDWSNGRICSGLIIKKIDSNGDAFVDYLYRPAKATTVISQSAIAHIENRQTLTFNDKDGSRYTFTLKPGNELAASFLNTGGTRLETKFTHATEAGSGAQAYQNSPPSTPVAKTPAEIEAYCQKMGDTEATGEGDLISGIENTVWRCMNKDVLVCLLGASGRACMAMDNSGVPTESVRDFCRQYPNRNVPNSANGTAFDWTCRGTNPVITGRTPVDERGYFKDAWRKIAVSDPPEKQVRQFVEELYSRRARPGRRSLLLDGAPDVFTTSLVKLLTENRKLLNGDLGVLDFDPFCQCQDDGGLEATIRKVSLYGIENATVDVDLLFPGGSRDSVRLALEEEQNHWRVRDVQSKKMESMRNALSQENKKLAASQTPPSSGSPSTPPPGPNSKPSALTAMPQGTRVVVDCIYVDHPSNGYGTTFRMAVPVGIDKLQSPDFAISLLNTGMQEAIKYCNDN
jgi:hypothetical protein